MTCNDHKANIPLVLQPWSGTEELQSWQMNWTLEPRNSPTWVLQLWSNTAGTVGISPEMSPLLLTLYHAQAPVNGTAFLSQLGSAELPSTPVQDFSFHFARISAVQSHWGLWGGRVYQQLSGARMPMLHLREIMEIIWNKIIKDVTV